MKKIYFNGDIGSICHYVSSVGSPYQKRAAR